jgi:TatA/E family protein of Tat protein translocase
MPTPGPLELVIILVIALLVLGPGRLPDVGSALGKSLREFRKASTDIQDAVKIDTSPLPPDPVAPTPPVASTAPTAPVAPAPVVPAPVAADAPTAAPPPEIAPPAPAAQPTSTDPSGSETAS